MKNLTTIVATTLALLCFVPLARAGPAGISRIQDSQAEAENGAALYVLENAAAEALQRARMTKGSRESCYLMKNVELRGLIQRLENGERVTVDEIYDAVDGLLGELSYRQGSASDCV